MEYVHKDNHYINNNDFRDELIKHLDKRKLNKDERIPDIIGKAILAISNNLAKKGNFCGYTFREELVGDAIETCIKYLHNYDVTKSNNPFAYFTKICYFAFVRRIKKEKTQFQIRRNVIKNIELLPDEELANFQEIDKGQYYLDQYREFLKDYSDNYENIYVE